MKNLMVFNKVIELAFQNKKAIEKVKNLLESGATLYGSGKTSNEIAHSIYKLTDGWNEYTEQLTDILIKQCPEFNHRETFGNRIIACILEEVFFQGETINTKDTFDKIMSRDVNIENNSLEFIFKQAEEALVLHWFDQYVSNMSVWDQQLFKDYRLVRLFNE